MLLQLLSNWQLLALWCFYDVVALTDCSHMTLENTVTQRSRWEHALSTSWFDGWKNLTKPIVVRGYNAVFQTHSLSSRLYWETVQIVVILISEIIRKSRNPRFLSVSVSHICTYRKFLDQTSTFYSPLPSPLLIMATVRCFRRHAQNSHKIMHL